MILGHELMEHHSIALLSAFEREISGGVIDPGLHPSLLFRMISGPTLALKSGHRKGLFEDLVFEDFSNDIRAFRDGPFILAGGISAFAFHFPTPDPEVEIGGNGGRILGDGHNNEGGNCGEH